MTTRTCIADLMEVAADLLGHLGHISGLRVTVQPTLTPGIRVRVANGHTYDDVISPLDEIATRLDWPVARDRRTTVGFARATGTFNGHTVGFYHLHGAAGGEDGMPCQLPAADLARHIRSMTGWARQNPIRRAEYIDFYDRGGNPQVTAIVQPDAPLDEALRAALDLASPIQHHSDCIQGTVAHGSALLPDGTTVTVRAVAA